MARWYRSVRTSVFQPSHTSGSHGPQVGGRQHVEHLQQLGRADLHGEADHQFLVAGVAAEGQVVHPQVLVDEELQGLGLVRPAGPAAGPSARRSSGPPRDGPPGSPCPGRGSAGPGAARACRRCRGRRGPAGRHRPASRAANSTARMQCSSTVYLWYWLNCSSPRARANSGMNRSRMPASCRSRSSGPEPGRVAQAARGNGGRPRAADRRSGRRSLAADGLPGAGAIGTSCRLARSTSRMMAVRLPRSAARPRRVAIRPAGPTRKSSSTRWPSTRVDSLASRSRHGGLGQELRDHVAHLAGVAEVVLHELLDAAAGRRPPCSPATRPGGAARRGSSTSLACPAWKCSSLRRRSRNSVARSDDRQVLVAEQPRARRAPAARAGRSGQSRSSGAVEVAQRARRPLDVRLQQEHGLAVAEPLFAARLWAMARMSRPRRQ